MKSKKFDLSHVEPAHPMQVKLQENLFHIYSHIRSNFQSEIDKSFNTAARQIGFVITTTMSVTLKLDKGGTVSGGIIIDGFQDTIIEKSLNGVLGKMTKTTFPKEIDAGEFKIYLFWFEALKLKLRTDWMEPVHYGRYSPFDLVRYQNWNEIAQSKENSVVNPEVQEPVHWFDPGISISVNELILVNVIDEIYPELGLVKKITSIRESGRRAVRSEVTEPVHFRRTEQGLELNKVRNLLNELDSILKRCGY